VFTGVLITIVQTHATRDGFAYRLCILTPWASGSKGPPAKCGTHKCQFPIQDEFDEYPSTIHVVTIHEI